MLMPRFVVCVLSVGMMILGAGVVFGQNYPNKPIRIVTAETGGSNDIAARQIAQALTDSLGQQLVVDNRGGNTNIPAQIVAQAPPDGYTLLLYNSNVWTLPLIQNVSYDMLRDFSSITLIGSSPNILVVHPSVPVKSIKELIALAKARPGELNYASGPNGASSQLAAELFKAMAGVNIMRVPYKGGGPALIGLMGGEVQLMFPPAVTVAPHLKLGRLRALAITSAQPSALFPNLPTVAASGLLGYAAVSSLGLFAPVKTPVTIINRLNQEIVRVLNRVEVKERFQNAGIETIGSSPEQLSATMKAEMAELGKVIKDAGIRAD